MKGACAIRPKVKVRNNKGLIVLKSSQLFDDLSNALHDRESTKFLYGFSKQEEVKKLDNIEYDSMGEVTAASLIKSLDLESTVDDLEMVSLIEKQLDIVKDGQPRVMDIFTAVDIMDKYNGTDKKFIVTPLKAEDGYTLKVVPRTGDTLQRAKDITFNNELNNQLLEIMRDLGFDLTIVDSADFAGLFDPTTARFSDGFIQIMKIVRGEVGEKAFPEEFSHLIIEGLKNHPLVRRLLATIDDSIAREVLGDEYEQYSELYKNDRIRMAKEVAGKLLADKIVRGGSMTATRARGNLLLRTWGHVKSLFSRVSDNKIKSARDQADRLVDRVYEGIKNRTIIKLFDKKALVSGDKLYKVQENLTNLRDMSFRALKLVAKKIEIVQAREGRSRLSKEDRNTLEALLKDYDNGKYLDSINYFLLDAAATIEALNKDFKSYRELDNIKESPDVNMLASVARLLRRIKEFTDGYGDIIADYARLDEDNILARINASSENKLTKSIAMRLAQRARDINNIIRNMRDDYATMSYDVIYAYMRTIYGEDMIVNMSQFNKEEQAMVLELILDHAARDINWVDRLFSSMADMDDPLMTFIKTAVDKKKAERDKEFMEIAKEIAALEKELRDAGFKNDFMYEYDENGVPTGYLISQYDFKGYWEQYRKVVENLKKQGKKGDALRRAIKAWKTEPIEVMVNGRVEQHKRVIKLYYDEESRDEESGKYMEVPNPAIFKANANRINNLSEVLRKYYNRMIELKKQAMLLVPTRGYTLYQSIYISKKGIDGILANTRGDVSGMARAVLQHMKSAFVRRADEIDVDRITENKEEILELVTKLVIKPLVDKEKYDKVQEEVSKAILETASIEKLEEKITNILKEAGVRENRISIAVLKISGVVEEYLDNNYDVSTDFTGLRLQKLPTNYMRKLKNMKDMSTDFSSAMQAYMGMALNYSKMNEIVDIMEITRSYMKEERTVNLIENGKPVTWNWKALSQHYNEVLSMMGASSNIAAAVDSYFASAIYGERKKRETTTIAGKTIDYGRVLDSLKNYSGMLGLGLNVFCALSNVAVGKIQQWIEACAGEYFTFKDYAKAQALYYSMLPEFLAELSNPIKQSKLGLLIERYDPAGDMFDKLNKSKHYSKAFLRIMGNSEFMLVGMNMGEHMLRCTTMLARLNNIKVRVGSKDGKEISLFDALEVKNENGDKRLELRPDVYYEAPVIEVDEKATNKYRAKNKGSKVTIMRYVREQDPKHPKRWRIKKEWQPYTEARDELTKRALKKINDLLNGAFSEDEAGSIHRFALGRLVMQFRRWMPKHYYRRFARSRWDNDLEQLIEGYWNTLGKFTVKCFKDIIRARSAISENWNQLTPHERANIYRCTAETSLFILFSILCGLMRGKIKLKDAGRAEKMLYYLLLRMRLEIGASIPYPTLGKNTIAILQSPMAAINTFNALLDMCEFGAMATEIKSGPYAGMSRYTKNFLKGTPGISKITLYYIFSEGMFSYMTK